MSDGRVIIDTKLDNSGISTGIASLTSMLKTGVKGAIAAMSISTLTGAIKSISDETLTLSDSIRKASTLFGDVSVDTDKLRNKMIELASATGTSSDAIGEALYQALSAGIPASEDMGEALDFIEKSAKLSIGGFADLGDTVKATASILNAYGMSLTEVEKVQGILMQTQNLGITTVGELASNLADVIPTAASFGVEFEQIGASLASMTAMGTKTAQATTSLNAMISELGKSGQTAADNLTAAAIAAGLGEKNFRDLIDDGYTIADILDLMDEYAQSNNLSLVDMFGSIEAGRGALQLASNDGEKFNESLAQMQETAGLVDSSFSKVLSNTERFKANFTELKRLIGGEFAPAVDSVVGGMADMLEEIINSGREANLLEGEYQDLIKAIDDYRASQENAEKATGSLSRAMASQGKQAMALAVFESIDAYDKATKSVKDLEEENDKLEAKIKNAFNDVIFLAEEYGIALNDVAKAYENDSAMGGTRLHELVVEYARATSDTIRWNEQLLENNAIIEESNSQISKYISSLVTLYRDGVIDIDLYKMANEDLYNVLMSYEGGMEKATQQIRNQKTSVETLTSSVSFYTDLMERAKTPEAWAKWSAYAEVYSKELEKQIKLEEERTKAKGTDSNQTDPTSQTTKQIDIQAQINQKLADAEKLSLALGDSYNLLENKISIATSGIKELIASGLNPENEIVKDLVKNLKNWQEALDADSIRSSADVHDDLAKSLEEINNLEEALGDNYDDNNAKIGAYTDAITELIAIGIDPASEEVQSLVKNLEALKKTIEEPPEVGSWKDIEKVFSDFVSKESLSKNITNVLTSSFDSLVDSISTAKQRIEDLKDEELGYQAELIEAEEERGDIQAEILDAQARGDEEAEESAKKKLAVLEKQIEGLEDVKEATQKEREAIEDGSEMWKEFGRSALHSLAEVLMGLGHELTARAVAAALLGNWGGAGIAGFGAAVAYGAAAGLKTAANSFATGGIVQKQSGVSATGDNHLAFVNAGELILNQAQQSNLADQIRAMSDAMTRQGDILINMSGAYIYGLDEPSVGRAIYDNIENLRAEGVL